jgi:LysM repeat protein
MKSRTKQSVLVIFSVLGFVTWIWFLSSVGLSEGYRIRRGDTLASIAHNYGVTIQQLRATNNIANPNLIQAGRVLVIPERHASIGTVGTPARTPGQRKARMNDPVRIQRLRDGLSSGWIVTRNPSNPDKIFVHESESGGYLRNLQYLARQSPDGQSWTVYLPVSRADGGTGYGRKIGVIDAPTNITIGDCGCE